MDENSSNIKNKQRNICMMMSNYYSIDIRNKNDCHYETYWKLMVPENTKTILHRWNPPCPIVYTIEDCDISDYFINSENTTFINTLKSKKNSEMIIQYCLNNKYFKLIDFKFNNAYDILDLSYGCVFEARIITCFFIDNEKSMNNIYWDLFLDHLNVHLYVSTNLLVKLMKLRFSRKIISMNLRAKMHPEIQQIPQLKRKKKSTTFVTMNETTLEKHFNYENNVLELKDPKILNNNLIFAIHPKHVGNGIVLSKQ